MNKTVTINIAGLIFHIDENAYNKLDSYIKAVRNSIYQEGEEEIISDIESRIAELFNERVDQQSGVISMANVDEIINIMGKPEDYIIEDEPIRQKNTSFEQPKGFKKIYRDGEKRILGGVSSGLGHYFNIDPVWIRLIFILLVLLYGTSVLAYLILWIVIPKASTVSEVLEMKGEPVNISNIEKQFREGVNSSYQAIKNNGKSAADVIRKLFGIALIVFSSFSIISTFFLPLVIINKIDIFTEFSKINQIDLGLPLWSINLAIFLASAIPFIILFLCGIKVLYPKTKHIGLTSAILGFIWLISAGVLTFLAINIGVQKNKFEEILDNYYDNKISVVDLDLNDNDTLKVIFERDKRIYTINDTINGLDKFYENDDVELEILQSTNGRSYIEIEQKMLSSNNIEINANDFAKVSVMKEIKNNALNYNYLIKNDTLVLSNSILATKNSISDDNEVSIKVYLKPSQKVNLNGNDRKFILHGSINHGSNYYMFNNQGNLRNTKETIN